MRISVVDESATLGSSVLHRTSPVAKLLAFACVLAAVVVNANVLVIAGIVLTLAAVVVFTALPLRSIAVFAAYPAFFSLLFALGTAAGPLEGSLIIAKAVTAALAALILIFTTPYPQVFAPVQRVVPRVVGDAMLMTYRSLFLLLQKFQHLFTAVRLRSGLTLKEPVRTARATTSALAGLVLYSVDLSQRDYDVMRLRGYEGRLRARLPHSAHKGRDAVVVLGAAWLLAIAVVFRVLWYALNPLSWIVPVLGLGVLFVATLLRWRSAHVRST